jgi:threonine/homoserine/homoserine lactone efflux protein
MFLTGMTTSLLNPKGLLLFFASLPLFVDTQAGDVPRQGAPFPVKPARASI